VTEVRGSGQGAEPGAKAERTARLLARARELTPVVAERAARCEALRRLPEETEQAFREAGFYRILQPERFGGLELDYGIQTELAAEIGRGCASSAWNLSVTACHAWMLGMFPEAAQRAVWGDDPSATISTSFLPRPGAAASRGEGGWRVTGQWGFSSGADYCQAAIVQAMISPAPDAPPEAAFLLIGRDDYQIEDSWHATALCGTGSNDLVFDGAFVPDEHVLMVRDTRGGGSPGSAVNPGTLYRLPLYAVFPFNLIGAALGASAGALDAIAAGLGSRETVTRADLGKLQSVQLRIADAAARIGTARAALRQIGAEMNARTANGEEISLEAKLECRIALGQAARLCVEAVDTLFPLLGGRGLAVGDAAQRAWRDVHAVAQHIGLVWDVQAGLYGAVKLGQPCPDPKI